MENNTTTAEIVEVTTVAAPEKSAKKQFTINTTESDKKAFEEFCNEHSGPSKADKDKPKFLTSHEGFSAIWEVATNRRFESVYTYDEEGEVILDDDGQPVLEVIDHLENAANRIIAKRDEVDIEKQVAELRAKLALLEKLGWTSKK